MIATQPADPLTFDAAQREMRHAYRDGAPGMLVSATMWLIAGCVAWRMAPAKAVWALFVGGMLIHPLSVLVCRMLGRPARHSPANPLGALAMASTFWLILMLPLAYYVSLTRIEWFFPAMLAVIGGRYLTFATLFGNRLYWACGATLALAAYLLANAKASPALGAFTGAAVEAAYAVALLVVRRGSRDAQPVASVPTH
jgi:hypothetical protein